MDKLENVFSHGVVITERKNINISGVKKIENFDSEEFLIETGMGYINLKGESLEIVKLDTIEGNVVIKGKTNSLVYLDNIKKKDKQEGVFSKLFK